MGHHVRFQPGIQGLFVGITADLLEHADEIVVGCVNLVAHVRAEVQEHEERCGVVLTDEGLAFDDGRDHGGRLVEWVGVALVAEKQLIGQGQHAVEHVAGAHTEASAVAFYEQCVHVEDEVLGDPKAPHVIQAPLVCETLCRTRRPPDWPSRRTWRSVVCAITLRGQ